MIFSLFTRTVMLFLQTNSPLETQHVQQTKLDLRQGPESAGLYPAPPRWGAEEFCEAESFYRKERGNPRCHPMPLLYRQTKVQRGGGISLRLHQEQPPNFQFTPLPTIYTRLCPYSTIYKVPTICQSSY